MRRLAGGDGQAFDQVFDELWPLLLGYCRKALLDGDQAQDAAQRALLKLFEQASQYDARKSALSWALSFAFWECRTERSRQRRQRTKLSAAYDMNELPSRELSPEDAVSHAEELTAIRALLEELPREDRALLWQEMESELASTLRGVKPATIRKRRQRLFEQLRLAWRRIVQPGEEA